LKSVPLTDELEGKAARERLWRDGFVELHWQGWSVEKRSEGCSGEARNGKRLLCEAERLWRSSHAAMYRAAYWHARRAERARR
jgi:hypothetical protein